MLETAAAPAAIPAPPAPVPSPSTGSTAVDSSSAESASADASIASSAAESPSIDEDRFLAYVPPEVIADASLPLAYQLISPAGYGDQRVSFRAAASTHARAKVFTPLPYHKPITRCYGGRE